MAPVFIAFHHQAWWSDRSLAAQNRRDTLSCHFIDLKLHNIAIKCFAVARLGLGSRLVAMPCSFSSFLRLRFERRSQVTRHLSIQASFAWLASAPACRHRGT